MHAFAGARGEIGCDLRAGKHFTCVSAAQRPCVGIVFRVAARRGPRLSDEPYRLGAIEKVVRAWVLDDLHWHTFGSKPCSVTSARFGRSLIVGAAEEHQYWRARGFLGEITRVATGIQGDVSDEPRACLGTDAMDRLKCGGQRYSPAARETHQPNALRINSRMRGEQAERGMDVGNAGHK